MVVLNMTGDNPLESYFLGTDGDVNPISRQAWRSVFYVVVIIFASCFVFEGTKFYYDLISEMTFHSGYPTELNYLIVSSALIYITLFISTAVLVSIAIKISIERSGNSRRTLWLFIMFLAISAVMFVIAVLRFLVAVYITRLFADPADAWIFRFYNGLDLVMEWKSIPEVIENMALMIGVGLLIVTVIDHASKIQTFVEIMDHGKRGDPERITMNGKETKISCKEWNGLKACEID